MFQTSLTASVYLTISLTMERYFSVVCPFKQIRNSWMKSPLCLSLPGLAFSLVFTLPHYFQMKTITVDNLILLSEDHTLIQVSSTEHNIGKIKLKKAYNLKTKRSVGLCLSTDVY
jgi:hypothetical protein